MPTKKIDDWKVHIIDPKNGISIFYYDTGDDITLLTEMECVERAAEEFEKSGVLEDWRALTERESYRYTLKMFNALMDAQRYREKQKELVEKEKDEKMKMIAK